jgi:TatD DNase family protein
MNILPSYIDTHCHLDSVLKKMNISSYQELKEQYFPASFAGCLHVACEPHSLSRPTAFFEHKDVFGAFGLHPHNASLYSPAIELDISRALQHPRALAWGETGLDYHYNLSPPQIQRNAFILQLKQAVILKKPIIIHTRQAEADTLNILQDHIPLTWPIHLHCFTGSPEFSQTLLNSFSNLYLGFTGVVTFKNADALLDVVKVTPLNRILLETDSPYMAPVPNRGKVCHPGMVPLIAQKLADIKNTDINQLFFSVRTNTHNLYGI